MKEPEGQSIDEAIKAKPGEKVTVKFEIALVRYAWHTGFGAKEGRTIMFEPKEKLKGGNTFQVTISDKAVTHLFNLGLMNERQVGGEYFQGKTIRVTGKVEALEGTGRGAAYRLVITDLDNLEVVK